MLLTRPASSSAARVRVTHHTVIEPGDRLEVEIEVEATVDLTVRSLDWQTPAGLILDDSTPLPFPAPVPAGDRLMLRVTFDASPADDTYGFLEATLTVDAPGLSQDESTVRWRSWVSVFRRESANDPDGLSVAHRRRLTDVVNHDDSVGHWMLADPWAFFDHFLNLDVAASIQGSVGDALGIGDQGLPFDEELRHEIWIDRMSFYGVVRIHLAPEEECVASDDHIDFSPSREVDPETDLVI